jgi:hypothetical protein
LDKIDDKLKDLEERLGKIDTKIETLYSERQQKQQEAMIRAIVTETYAQAQTEFRKDQLRQNANLADLLDELRKEPAKRNDGKIDDALKRLREGK